MPSCLKIYVIDDAMFLSLAEQRIAEETVAVLLTGMGADGSEGLASMYKQGAYSIAQPETSCAGFGMPKAAVASGVVTQVLPLEYITEVVTG